MYPLACTLAAVQLLTYSSTCPVRTSLYLNLDFSLLTTLCTLDFSLRGTAKPQLSLGFHAFPSAPLHVCTTPDSFEERPFFTTSSRLSFLSANFLILFSGLISCFKTYKSVETSLRNQGSRVSRYPPSPSDFFSLSPVFIFRALSIIRH